MEGLYKVDKIDGKGLGWIALQDIKAGKLICKEKPQFVPKNLPRNFLLDDAAAASLVDCFFAMSKDDQKEYLELQNIFLDLNSLHDESKKQYFNWKMLAESQNRFDSNLLLKIICICRTNAIILEGRLGVGIKFSRINHSCCPNATHFDNDDGEMEIRATSKILEGQEISISYFILLKNFEERQKTCHMKGFVCSCELCKDEEINNDDESYKKFQDLEEEAEKAQDYFELYLHGFEGKTPWGKKLEQIEKAISCQRQMFNLARKKAPKLFIHGIINQAFLDGFSGKIR